MITQNTINGTQVAQPDRHSQYDAPKAVIGITSNTKPVTVESQFSSERLSDINEVLRQSNQDVQFEFSMDADTKKSLFKVVDTKTGELIRQIPSEEMLAIVRSIDHFRKGFLFKEVT